MRYIYSRPYVYSFCPIFQAFRFWKLRLFLALFECSSTAFSLEFQKTFSITRAIFSHSRSEQFWQLNTITSDLLQLYVHCKPSYINIFLYRIINFLFIQPRKVCLLLTFYCCKNLGVDSVETISLCI